MPVIQHLRTFYILTITQLFSLIGSRMTGIAMGIYVFDKTGNTAPLLIAAFFAEIPGMIGGSLTGILADRWDKRYVIILGDVGQAAGTLLLMVSFLSGVFELWHLYSIMLIQGIFGTIQSPASQAAIAVLVPEDQRDRANGIKEIGFPLAGVIAPVIAGLIYSVTGVGGVMAFDLFTFVVAVSVVFSISIPQPESSEAAAEENFWQAMLGGWRFLLARRALLGLVLYISFINFLINGPLDLAIPYVVTLTGSEAQLGFILAAMNLGAFAGALSITLMGKLSNRVGVILRFGLVLGVLFCIYGVVRHPVLLGVLLFAILFPLPITNALMSTILQNKTPADVQGRVFAVTGQLFMIATPFSFLLTGALVDNLLEPAVGKTGWERVSPLVGSSEGAGIGLLLIGVGVVIFVTSLLVYLVPSIRRLETTFPDYTVLIDEEAFPTPEQVGLT